MPDIRLSRAKKNIFVSLGCQLLTLLCGIIVPKVMLSAFGSEVYGATTSIAQFLSYIALLEGGIGGVARAVLYKPLAENDVSAISAIMAEIRRFFRVIALVFLAYVVVLACSFKTISRVDCLDWASTALLVGVISISTFAQYFVGISNAILLQAAQKSYITNFVNILGTVVNTVMIIVLVALDCDIIVVKLVSSIIFVMRPVILWLYVRRSYRLVRCETRDKTYLTQKWSGLGQHIAYFLHSNTDVVILTCFADLKAVAVYAVYNMVVANIQNLSMSFVSGMEALFGDMLAKKELKQLHRTFSMYETIISVIAVLLFAVTAVMILPFVRIYTADITDANYEAPLFALLLVLAALLYCLRLPYHSVVIAAGHFRQTSWAAYGEAAINVLLSILLVKRLGLVGVAIGTVAATAFRLVYYVVYLSRQVFCRAPELFVKRVLVNGVAFALSVMLGDWLTSHIAMPGYAMWVVGSVLTVMVTAAVTLMLNLLFYREDCGSLASKVLTGRR